MPGERCRSCGAPIIWAQTVNGKAMPIDAEPVPDGNVLLTGRRVETRRGTLAPECRVEGDTPMFPDGADRYMSHFATCPQADQWRKS